MITTKLNGYQIVIPQEIREKFDISPDSVVIWGINDK
ncbi:MAG: AbrB/MazE/SpoVT family DNA-binding domain-containing protein [Methanobrevibacter sp.]|jgi:bifunctional DNA-binding transcriptional regulator/antitoxin component of YhaV-PrlF toxin-antitoxin module|nr:AbrB/MazE/SpoVT family DNA-binding domain-containing protein [Methanobrevibacter sp.]